MRSLAFDPSRRDRAVTRGLRPAFGWRRAASIVLLSALPQSTAASDWQSIGPEGGRIDDFVQSASNPNRMYALPQSQGVTRSEDRGDTWSRVDSGLALDARYRALAVSPTDPALVLLGEAAANYVLRSTDSGVSWSSHAVGAAWGSLETIAFDPHDEDIVLLATTGGAGIHRSTDGGLSWVSSNTGLVTLDSRPIEFHPALAGVVLTGTSDGIFRSTDGGLQWAPVSTPGSGAVRAISFCAGSPNRVWASREARVYVSNDGGLTFAQPSGPALGGVYVDALAAHPSDPATVLGASLYGTGGSYLWTHLRLWRSTNGGMSWAHMYDTGEIVQEERTAALLFDSGLPARAYFAVGDREATVGQLGLLRSLDSGASFGPWMNGIFGTGVLAMGCGRSGSVHALGPAGGFLADSLGGSWTWGAPSWSVIGLTTFRVNPAVEGVVEIGGGVLQGFEFFPYYARSNDGGLSWRSPGFIGWYGPGPSAVVSDLQDGKRVYVWSPFDLIRSDDGGRSFGDPIPSFDPADVAIDPNDRDRLFAVDRWTGAVNLTTDAGVTWTPRAIGLPASTPRSLFLDVVEPTPGPKGHLLVVYVTAGMYESTDSGATWTSIPGSPGAPVLAATWDAVGGRAFLLTTGSSVRTSNGASLDGGLPTHNLTSIAWLADRQTLLVGTHHAGILALGIPPQTVDATLPLTAEPSLTLRVFPTPTRGAANIELAVPAGRPVDLAVYSVDGRRVATLLSGIAAGGRQLLRWEGPNCAAGVYFVQLNAGKGSVVRRLVRLQ